MDDLGFLSRGVCERERKEKAHRVHEFFAINPVSTLTFFADVYRRCAR